MDEKVRKMTNKMSRQRKCGNLRLTLIFFAGAHVSSFYGRLLRFMWYLLHYFLLCLLLISPLFLLHVCCVV